MQISGLVFKSSVWFGRIFLSDGFKMPLLLWGWQICWRGKKWPSVSSDSAYRLGIWGWIGPLFTSPSPNPRINTKMDFLKPPFEKIRDLRRFFSGVRDLLILKKKGGSPYSNRLLWLEITLFSHEKCDQVLVIYSSQAAGCMFASYIPETSFCTLQGSLFKQEFYFLQPLRNSTISSVSRMDFFLQPS